MKRRHHHRPHRGPRGPGAEWRGPPSWKWWRMRWRLQRRIFLWFGLTILLTGALVGTIVTLTGASGWRRDFNAMQSFAGSRFERVWDDPVQRDELARSMHETLHAEIALEDDSGRPMGGYGVCNGRHRIEIPVERGTQRIGMVGICPERRHDQGWRLVLGLVVMLGVLWAASHAIARRLTRPLVEIERVARALASGDLKSRVDVERARGEDERLVGSTINEMADRIEKQIAEYRSLLAAVSHEIRTPLARMRLLVELSRLEELDKEIVGLDELVGELLAVSRVDFGAIAKRKVDVKDTAVRALEDARSDPSILALETDEAVEADPTLLVRAVRNLLENAERHGGGAKKLLVARKNGEVVFEVEDEGPGIPEGAQETIFEPFHKNGDDKRSVGLGLALVKRIAEAHGGRAYAENRPGKGARVGLALKCV
jgi:signal transduction histidine kinase